MTMSLVVLPSAPPGALSGSFEVTETSVTVGLGSTLSVATIVACTFTYLWLGGASVLGEALTLRVGGSSSHGLRPTSTGSWSEER